MGKASRRKRERRAPAWGPGVVLGDGHRYYRVRDIPAGDPILETRVKHFLPRGAIVRAPLREDPDMLVYR